VPKRLAEIVIDTGLATRDDVVKAAQIADTEHTPLVVALIRHSGVDELALVAEIKRQARIAIADPAVVEYDVEAIRELSRDTCWRLRVMPLGLSVYEAGPRTLYLAMADPTDTVAIAEVEHLTGCQVDTSLMPLSAIEELVEEAYRSFVTEVMPRKDKTAPTKSARKHSPGGRQIGSKAGSQTGSQIGPQTGSKAGSKASSKTGSGLSSRATPGSRPRDTEKTPFGGTLEISTEPMARLDDVGQDGQDGRIETPLAPGKTRPSTTPFHRVSDEASPEIRLRALLELLYRKELISPAEYDVEVRALMKRHKGEG
jgi:hypothetical protein